MSRKPKTVSEHVRRAVLDSLHPAVILAVSDGQFSSDKNVKAILIGEGLAKESGHGYLSWTPEGDVVRSCLDSEIEAYAARFKEAEPEPQQDKSALSMANVVSSLRDEAKARGSL